MYTEGNAVMSTKQSGNEGRPWQGTSTGKTNLFAKGTHDETTSNMMTNTGDWTMTSNVLQQLVEVKTEMEQQHKTLESYRENGMTTEEITKYSLSANATNVKKLSEILKEVMRQGNHGPRELLERLLAARDEEIASLKSKLQDMNEEVRESKRDLENMKKFTALRAKQEYALKETNTKLQRKVRELEKLMRSVEEEEEILPTNGQAIESHCDDLPTPELRPKAPEASLIKELAENQVVDMQEAAVQQPVHVQQSTITEPIDDKTTNQTQSSFKEEIMPKATANSDQNLIDEAEKDKTTPPSENVSLDEGVTLPVVQAELVKQVSGTETPTCNDEIYSVSSTQDSQKDQVHQDLTTFAVSGQTPGKTAGRTKKGGKLRNPSVKVQPIEEEIGADQSNSDVLNGTPSVGSILAIEVSDFEAGLLGCGVKLILLLSHMLVGVWAAQFLSIFMAAALMMGKTAMFLSPDLVTIPQTYKMQSVLRRMLNSGIKYAIYFFGVYVSCRFFKKDVSLSSLMFLIISELVIIVASRVVGALNTKQKIIQSAVTVVLAVAANCVLYQWNLLELFAKQSMTKMIITNTIGAAIILAVPTKKDFSQLHGIKNMVGFGTLVTWFYHFY